MSRPCVCGRVIANERAEILRLATREINRLAQRYGIEDREVYAAVERLLAAVEDYAEAEARRLVERGVSLARPQKKVAQLRS